MVLLRKMVAATDALAAVVLILPGVLFLVAAWVILAWGAVSWSTESAAGAGVLAAVGAASVATGFRRPIATRRRTVRVCVALAAVGVVGQLLRSDLPGAMLTMVLLLASLRAFREGMEFRMSKSRASRTTDQAETP
jgi:uncharacterized membrane protein